MMNHPLPDMPEGLHILGVRVHLVTPAQAMSLLERFAQDERSHHVVTVNPEFIMTAQHHDEFREILNGADLAIPDGVGVLWACRLQGHPLQARVTGVDTVRGLSQFAARRGLRLFLLGAAPGVAEEAGRILQRDNPGLEIAGTYAGSPAASEEDEIVARIQAARPNLLFVAYGAPKQDLWIARTRLRLAIPLAMGVGGTLDFITGRSRRAPAWMQRAGLEWLHRLLREPWRWRRMLALPQFACKVVGARLRQRAGR